MPLQIQIPWRLDLLCAGYWVGTFLVTLGLGVLGFFFASPLCEAKAYLQSLALDFGQK